MVAGADGAPADDGRLTWREKAVVDAGTMALGMLRGLGWAVPVAVLLPNILWATMAGAAPPESPTAVAPSWVQWVRPVEWVGRAAVLACLCSTGSSSNERSICSPGG